MPSEEVRVYAVIAAAFPAGSVSDEQWGLLFGAAKAQPLSRAVLDAARDRNGGAHTYITTDKRSQNAAYLRLYTMVGFELDRDDAEALLVVLDAQATARGVTGNVKDKFQGVLQGELRDAALSLGYNQTNANKLSVLLVNGDIPNAFERMTAIAQAQQYLASTPEVWYA